MPNVAASSRIRDSSTTEVEHLIHPSVMQHMLPLRCSGMETERHADTAGAPDSPLRDNKIHIRRQQQRDAGAGKVRATLKQMDCHCFRSLQQLRIRQGFECADSATAAPCPRARATSAGSIMKPPAFSR